MPTSITEAARRVLDRVRKLTGECWVWTGSMGGSNNAYGQIVINGRKRLCHRVVYEAFNRPIPAGAVVMHSCDNPACCNPAHLRVGSQTDNLRDAVQKGRHRVARGASNANAKLTEEQVRTVRGPLARGAVKRLAAEWGINYSHLRQIRCGNGYREVAA